MKKHFTKYLIEDLGFESFRKIITKEGYEYVKNNINDFSSMINGGLDLRYKKGNIEIIWGLNEMGKPPTLIYPRPNIVVISVNEKGQKCLRYDDRDDVMNICLKEENPEDIYNALFDRSIKFEYNK